MNKNKQKNELNSIMINIFISNEKSFLKLNCSLRATHPVDYINESFTKSTAVVNNLKQLSLSSLTMDCLVIYHLR